MAYTQGRTLGIPFQGYRKEIQISQGKPFVYSDQPNRYEMKSPSKGGVYSMAVQDLTPSQAADLTKTGDGITGGLTSFFTQPFNLILVGIVVMMMVMIKK